MLTASALSDLATLRSTLTFGTHDLALIWITVLSVLMLIGPAIGVEVYKALRNKAVLRNAPVRIISEDLPEDRQKAA